MSSSRTRLAGRALALAYLALLGFGVLTARPVLPDLPTDERFTFAWAADAARNVVLFLPLGLWVACRERAWQRTFVRTAALALGLSLGLSIGIELAQAWIPGRDASPIDVVSNGLGGLLGAALARGHAALLRARDRTVAAVSAAACLLAFGVLLFGAIALSPAPVSVPAYGGRTPTLTGMETYDGRVLDARVGGLIIPAGGPMPTSEQDHAVAIPERLERALTPPSVVVVELEQGSPPTALAPLVTIHDGDGREQLLIGLASGGLVVRRVLYALDWGLEHPTRQWHGALKRGERGERHRLRLTFARDAWHAEIDDRALAPRPWTPGRSWSLWLPGDGLDEPTLRRRDGLWIAALVLPAAYVSLGRRRGWLGLIALAGGLALLPVWTGQSAATGLEWGGFAFGAGSGLMLGRRMASPAATSQTMGHAGTRARS